MFKSVTRESTLTERAQLQIEDLIVGGSLKAGDRLPSEKNMTEKLGVSKTVIREAIRTLAAKGLVEVRAGSGTYVRDFGSDMMKEPMSLLLRSHVLKIEDIHEVRDALEVKIAGLAAERAQPGDIEAMHETIRALTKHKLTSTEFAEIDVAFHNRLAAAARNPLFSALIDSLNDVMIEVRLRAFNVLGEARTVKDAVHYHSQILKRVKAGDAPGARHAMEEHLVQGKEVLRRAGAEADGDKAE